MKLYHVFYGTWPVINRFRSYRFLYIDEPLTYDGSGDPDDRVASPFSIRFQFEHLTIY
jgi:hypothetical protein